jgi:hypothetical protein
MHEKTCGTCKHYQPATDFEGCGICTETSVWSARTQEVMADMHACAELGSRWAALSIAEPAQTRTLSEDETLLPEWVPWLRWAGGIGLALSPVVFFVDLFVGIPGIPELFLIWFLLFAGVALVGFFWGKI